MKKNSLKDSFIISILDLKGFTYIKCIIFKNLCKINKTIQEKGWEFKKTNMKLKAIF